MLDPNEQIDGLVKIVERTERERDEAREALRDLLAAIDRGDLCISEITAREEDEVTYAALRGAHTVLEGVERTHALVPVEALRVLADCTVDAVDRQERALGEDAPLTRRIAHTARAVARGERPGWPS